MKSIFDNKNTFLAEFISYSLVSSIFYKLVTLNQKAEKIKGRKNNRPKNNGPKRASRPSLTALLGILAEVYKIQSTSLAIGSDQISMRRKVRKCKFRSNLLHEDQWFSVHGAQPLWLCYIRLVLSRLGHYQALGINYYIFNWKNRMKITSNVF